MDEQPIDNLFKRKLHDAEIKPSASAWGTLEARRNRQRVVSIWTYMAIAASLLIVGSFGWWAVHLQHDIVTPNPVAVRATPRMPLITPLWKTDIRVAKNDLSILENIKKPDLAGVVVSQRSPSHISYKTHEVLQESGLQETQVDRQPIGVIAARVEIPHLAANPVADVLPVVATTKEMYKDVIAPAPERTLIVSIDVLAEAVPLPAKYATAGDSTSRRTGFSGLLRKVKRIKDGDVLALSATNSTKTIHRGFGKFYDEVKESIKNNAAD